MQTLALYSFAELAAGRPEQAERRFRVPAGWLQRPVSPDSDPWCVILADNLPGIAGEGEILLCRDATLPLVDNRYYLFMLGGRPLVRRVSLHPDGVLLISTDRHTPPLLLPSDRGDREEQLLPIGYVVGIIGCKIP